MKRILMVTLAAVVLFAQSAWCAEQKVTIESELSYVSSYIWRGFDLLPDNNDAIQPGVTFTFGDSGHDVNIWASAGLDKTHDLDEIDLSWDYTKPVWKDVSLSVGLIYYAFPSAVDKDSDEFYTGLTFSALPLQPTVMLFNDFGSGDGSYVSLGLSKSLEFGKRSIDFGFNAGYQDGYWGVEPGISDVSLSISTVMDVGTVYVIPSINYVHIPEQSVNPDEDEFWVGITAVTKIDPTNDAAKKQQ